MRRGLRRASVTPDARSKNPFQFIRVDSNRKANTDGLDFPRTDRTPNCVLGNSRDLSYFSNREQLLGHRFTAIDYLPFSLTLYHKIEGIRKCFVRTIVTHQCVCYARQPLQSFRTHRPASYRRFLRTRIYAPISYRYTQNSDLTVTGVTKRC